MLSAARRETLMIKVKGGRDCRQNRFLGKAKRQNHLTTQVAGWL